tara:strand:+ start:133 stop:534 length:402 start_codon:yes stop_codon:yes gene_type:complete
MSLKVYLYKYDQLLPIVLLVSNTSNENEEKIYEKYYLNFYEILFSKDIIDEKSILIFCNFKNGAMKKQLQIQGSINSDKDIMKDLNGNIKNIDFVVNQIIRDYSANFLLELSDSLKIKSTNTRLNLLLKLCEK